MIISSSSAAKKSKFGFSTAFISDIHFQKRRKNSWPVTIMQEKICTISPLIFLPALATPTYSNIRKNGILTFSLQKKMFIANQKI